MFLISVMKGKIRIEKKNMMTRLLVVSSDDEESVSLGDFYFYQLEETIVL